jgi:DNA-binding NarL/FixJ family response regulator
MNGWRFLELYRGRYPGCRAAVVLISALPNLASEASRLGVRGYLRKPFGLDAIVEMALQCCPAASDHNDGAAR